MLNSIAKIMYLTLNIPPCILNLIIIMTDDLSFVFMQSFQSSTMILCDWYSQLHFFILFQERLLDIDDDAFFFGIVYLLTQFVFLVTVLSLELLDHVV